MRKGLHFLLVLGVAATLRAESAGQFYLRALESQGAWETLRELTETIGQRLTGSAQEARAGQWAQGVMRKAGLQNVHSEAWKLETSWERGYAQAALLTPVPLDLTIASRGWTGSTPKGAAEADVVLVDSGALDEETRKNSGKWAGKVLFMAPADPAHEDGTAMLRALPAFLTAAGQAGAVAVLDRDSRPGMLLAHTGPAVFSAQKFSVAYASVAQPQAEIMLRALRSHVAVSVRIDIRNRFLAGPVDSANIVGEIRGAEKPEEVVIVGAHLDSWDQGTGAVDDGFGVAAVLGAAQLLASSDAKPRRTIRFVLFTGEEQGLLGSRAYVLRHRAEIKDVVCALILDWGNGPITKFLSGGHAEFSGPLEELVGTLRDANPPRTGTGSLTYTDALAFRLAGVAGIEPFQDSRDYMMIGHSAADTLDQVDAGTLARDTALLGSAALWIADFPSRIGKTWQAEETIRSLDSQRQILKVLDLWPF